MKVVALVRVALAAAHQQPGGFGVGVMIRRSRRQQGPSSFFLATTQTTLGSGL